MKEELEQRLENLLITKRRFNQWVKIGWALKVVQNHLHEYIRVKFSKQKQLNLRHEEKMKTKGNKAWNRELIEALDILVTLKSDIEGALCLSHPKTWQTSVFYGTINKYYDWIEAIREKIKAQKRYCEKNNVPYFAPYDGICANCNKQIYNEISLTKARTELITGCPYCGWSYCE